MQTNRARHFSLRPRGCLKSDQAAIQTDQARQTRACKDPFSAQIWGENVDVWTDCGPLSCPPWHTIKGFH
jgi:hypothetical protein